MTDRFCPRCGLSEADMSADHTVGGLVNPDNCIADLKNLVARQRRQLDEAHDDIDLIYDAKARTIARREYNGAKLTVAGRIEMLREWVEKMRDR